MSKIFILAFVFAIIWKLSCGIGLDCKYKIGTWASIGNIYECSVISIPIETGSIETITVVTGTHLSGRTNADVQALYLYDKGLDYFPVNIAQFFPNMKALHFGYNSISYVNNQHLFPLPNLVLLCIYGNRITSLDSNLFSGLSMQVIDFDDNNIKHVGHDFILPNTVPSGGRINFRRNPCIDRRASTPSEITALRISLLENCQPSWLTNITVETQSLVNRTDGIEQSHSDMDNEINSLMNTAADLENRNLELTNEVSELQNNNVELTNEVSELQKNNMELSNEVTDVQLKNMQLETRIGFLDTRAGYLEVRVAQLESIIQNKLGLKIDEAISANVN